MGFRSCFTRAPSATPSAAALPAPPPPMSPRRADRRVRAPETAKNAAAAGFVPRSVAELHPEYAHSEPYHFAPNTASCRMVVESAKLASRRKGDLRLRAQAVPTPPRVVVRGPQYSARQKKLDDIERARQTLALAPADVAPETAAMPRPKSNVALVVERPNTYRPEETDENQDANAPKVKSPLFKRITSKKSPRKSAKSPAKTAPEENASPAVKAVIAHTRRLKEEVRTLQFDNVEDNAADNDAPPTSFTDALTDGAGMLKPVPVHPAEMEDDDALDEHSEMEVDNDQWQGEEDDDQQSHDWQDQSTFDERDVEHDHDHDHDHEHEHEYEHEHNEHDHNEHDHQDHEDQYDGQSTFDERDDPGYYRSEEESEADTEHELRRQYPDVAREDDDDEDDDSDSEDDSQPSVSADGFLAEEPSMSYTASARSSLRSSIRSSIRSSVRSSMRSSMRSAVDRYSVDSQYQNSTDGDRVASTFGFMVGGDDDSDNESCEARAIRPITPSQQGSFRDSDSDDCFSAAGSAIARPPVPASPAPRTYTRRREDSSLGASQPPPSPRRRADKTEAVYGVAEEASSGRVAALRAAPVRHTTTASAKRKTVSFRTDKPSVIIEPNLRSRASPPASPVPKHRLVSALRTTPKPPTRAELRDMPSPSSSYGSLPRISADQSPDSSFTSLGGTRHSRKSLRLPAEEVSRRRSMAVAEALAQQIRGVPRSAMLAYDEHDQSDASSTDESEQESIGASWRRSTRASLRPRARSSRAIHVPSAPAPGEVPEPPPPPPFAPAPTRVRSVRKAPPPPTAHVV